MLTKHFEQLARLCNLAPVVQLIFLLYISVSAVLFDAIDFDLDWPGSPDIPSNLLRKIICANDKASPFKICKILVGVSSYRATASLDMMTFITLLIPMLTLTTKPAGLP